jgi:hypothetical protein
MPRRPLLPDPSRPFCLTSHFQRLTNCLRFDTLSEPLYFQPLPTIKFCNSFLLITIRIAGGGYRGSPLPLASSFALTSVSRIGRRPVRGLLSSLRRLRITGYGRRFGMRAFPPYCLKLSTVNSRRLTASSHGSQGGFGGGPADLLMDWNAVIIQSRPRGRSSGCWFRCTKKAWKSKGAPPKLRNAEGSGGPPGRPGAGIWSCR